MIAAIRVNIIDACNGIYLRWYFNGWHYYYFTSNYEVEMKTTLEGLQVMQFFSVISKIEKPTKITAEYAYKVKIDGITPANIDAFANMLVAEKVEQYEDSVWREVDITRGGHALRDGDSPAYSLEFEITRKELPNTPAVYQKTQYFYIGDTLADLDDDEVIAMTKQVNDIAELQDRQCDFTASFKVRKTRAMQSLFELSGEVGAQTMFPYEQQTCRLVQDGIEVITDGRMVLLKKDFQYYHVSVFSGNKNFFTAISNLKLTDLTIDECDHTWNASTQAASHALTDAPYIYPLCEPSDDGGILPATDTGDEVTMREDYLWPFIRLKTIWDEIFTNAGYTCEGDILTNPIFGALYFPITNLTAGDTSRYLYSLYNPVQHHYSYGQTQLASAGNVVINGADDADWVSLTRYWFRYTGKYKLRVYLRYYSTVLDLPVNLPRIKLLGNEMQMLQYEQVTSTRKDSYYELEIDGVANSPLDIYILTYKLFGQTVYYYDVAITSITNATVGVSSSVDAHLNLPEMSQSEFIKTVCHLFALVPEARPRDRKILFWNYSKLYENIPNARDWSAYLSEYEDECEFKFGDYAQRNYLLYKDNDDVIAGAGKGVLQVNDATLEGEKEIVKASVSTCDEVLIMGDVRVARINMNKYQAQDDVYESNDKIETRIVYVAPTPEDLTASPVYQKTLVFKEKNWPFDEYAVVTPKRATTSEISFAALMNNYGALSKMLTKTTLRKLKFNLPAYEVAGFRHYVPIYLTQYRAYFYVNKINNYVNGKLCTVDVIKL